MLRKISIFSFVMAAIGIIYACGQAKDHDTDLLNVGKMLSVDLYNIRYTQDTISPTFSDGQHVKAVINKLNTTNLTPGDFPPIKVIEYKNPVNDVMYFSLDNRRLYTFKNSRYSNEKIQVVKATQEEAIEQIWKITSQNDGMSIILTNSPNKSLLPKENSILANLRNYIIKNAATRPSPISTCAGLLALAAPCTKNMPGNAAANKPPSADHAANNQIKTAVAEAYKEGATTAVKASKAVSKAFGVVGFGVSAVPDIVLAAIEQNASDADRAKMATASVPVLAGVTAAIAAKQSGKSDRDAAAAFFLNILGIDLGVFAGRCADSKEQEDRFSARFGRKPNTPNCPKF